MKTDLNGKKLFEGVEPIEAEFLKRQGHRWPGVCPDYVGVSMFAGKTMQSVLQSDGVVTPIAFLACRCGCVVGVPVGVG